MYSVIGLPALALWCISSQNPAHAMSWCLWWDVGALVRIALDWLMTHVLLALELCTGRSAASREALSGSTGA